MIEAVRKQGLQGVVAKRRDSVYEFGRCGGAWVKLRIGGSQEFVIGGYTPSAKNCDALVIRILRSRLPALYGTYPERFYTGAASQGIRAFRYAEWTPANHLRHSRFVALREDKDAQVVVKEVSSTSGSE